MRGGRGCAGGCRGGFSPPAGGLFGGAALALFPVLAVLQLEEQADRGVDLLADALLVPRQPVQRPRAQRQFVGQYLLPVPFNAVRRLFGAVPLPGLMEKEP